jgi:hypothetical protein
VFSMNKHETSPDCTNLQQMGRFGEYQPIPEGATCLYLTTGVISIVYVVAKDCYKFYHELLLRSDV